VRTETVYYLPERKRDRNGDFVGPTPEEVPIYGVVIWPRASEEKDGGEVNVDGENLATPDSSVTRGIRSDGRLRVRGVLHTVDEPPARYAGKRILIKTRRVTT
jgi:hypothetical protein